jgi:hypothetical protein
VSFTLRRPVGDLVVWVYLDFPYSSAMCSTPRRGIHIEFELHLPKMPIEIRGPTSAVVEKNVLRYYKIYNVQPLRGRCPNTLLNLKKALSCISMRR